MQRIPLHFRCFCNVCYATINEPLKIGSGQRELLVVWQGRETKIEVWPNQILVSYQTNVKKRPSG